METAKQDRNSAFEALVRFTEDLHIARATELARVGRLLEAEALLTANGGPRSAPEMDLLARISAQRRRLDQAASWWQAAQGMDPANGDYKRGLEAVTDEGRKQARRQKALLWASLVMTAILMAAVAVLIWTKPNRAPQKKPGIFQPPK
jgi:hypothetical protein